MTITTATLRDESGAIRAVWFNQPYLEETLSQGTVVSVAGKVVLDKRGLYLSNPIYEKVGAVGASSDHLQHTGRLIPIYPETEGVTSKFLRYLIQPILETLNIPDPLPETIRRQYDLADLNDALRVVHYPESEEAVPAARERLAFDDLLLTQHGGVEVLTVTMFADHKTVQGLRQRERFDEFAVLAIDLDASIRFLDADIDVASGVHGDLAMSVADGFFARRRCDEVGDKIVSDFSVGAADES
jgi:RecG-like helicase